MLKEVANQAGSGEVGQGLLPADIMPIKIQIAYISCP